MNTKLSGITNLDDKKKEIQVSIPITIAKSKVRVKRRNIFYEYGLAVSTRSVPLDNKCYIEWQIGYDVPITNTDKLQNSTCQNLQFNGSNGERKCLYELSEWAYYFYKWNVITKKELLDIKSSILSINDDMLLDINPDVSINRTHPIKKIINGLDFCYTEVKHPSLVYDFGNCSLITEIEIKEKQFAVGTMPMLYLCFLVSEFDQSIIGKPSLIGRTADKNEMGIFVIDKDKKNMILQALRIFGMLSINHKKDVLSIIETILL